VSACPIAASSAAWCVQARSVERCVPKPENAGTPVGDDLDRVQFALAFEDADHLQQAVLVGPQKVHFNRGIKSLEQGLRVIDPGVDEQQGVMTTSQGELGRPPPIEISD